MIDVAKEFPNTKFLAYTKRNNIDFGVNLPPNLRIRFSMWEGWENNTAKWWNNNRVVNRIHQESYSSETWKEIIKEVLGEGKWYYTYNYASSGSSYSSNGDNGHGYNLNDVAKYLKTKRSFHVRKENGTYILEIEDKIPS